MTSIGEEVKQQIYTVLESHYLHVLQQQINDEVEQMKVIISEANAFSELPSTQKTPHSKIASYKSQLRSLIDPMWGPPEELHFAQLYPSLNETIVPIFEKIDLKSKKEQTKERFYSIESDSSLTKVLKVIKRGAFYTSRIPIYLSHKIKGRSLKVPYWKRIIPLRNLSRYHFHNLLILDLRQITDHFFQRLCETYNKVKDWEEHLTAYVDDNTLIDIEKELDQFKALMAETIKQKLPEILDNRVKQFAVDYAKVGTFEFSNRILTDSALKSSIEDAEIKWAINNQEWKNTIYALFEKWKSDLEIHTLGHKTQAELLKFQAVQIRKLGEQIDPEINAIKLFIQESLQSFSTQKSDSFKKELKKISNLAIKKLEKELIPQLTDKLSSQSISNWINKLELKIKESVGELSNEHVIVKSNAHDAPIKTDDLKSISAYELIAFEILVSFQNQLDQIKKELFDILENTALSISDLGHIITFSISSSIAAIDEEGKTIDETRSIALEGLERAASRLGSSRQDLESSMVSNSEKLNAVVTEFCSSILALTVNENVGELRLRIVKAKTAKKAEEVKKELQEKIQIRKRWIFKIFKNTYRRFVEFINNVGEKFILTASHPTKTREVSDFLHESQHIIDSLPLIYRRLYQIEPLEDLELFEGRTVELSALKEAFGNWDKGRYAATTLLSEKWGGLTTFINYAIQSAKYPYKVTRIAPKENICSEEGLIGLMKVVFKQDSFENLNQVVDYLNSGSKRIVVLEDMQNLYLRKIDGFTALQLLFQLITRTFRNVFWITSTTIYTWQYLRKAINIDEYFSYLIEMRELTNEQIVNIIWKRNRISGYNIRFIPDEEMLESKKFLQLTEADQQLKLKQDYFSALNSFAKSNVSLALIFWLLSTKNVDERNIEIGSFKKPDLNFITVLSMEKVFILNALILHDGLTESHLINVLNTNQTSCRLTLMSLLESGIIFQKEDVFMVNLIVYRDIVGLLKSKNLIH